MKEYEIQYFSKSISHWQPFGTALGKDLTKDDLACCRMLWDDMEFRAVRLKTGKIKKW